mmetsp:Transcript_4799/g.8257  ORF Transcript_4799/g.8257 Transcript_4799/m.8257 type:complete len:197 (-) Transcript_4799:175-765(-)|eukprot:CAMPEP_0198212018 /NCGR_PEP_ID=MMETSP1445-20131203/25474_1 /TAXON_ID=36898 /ORGANISM="Pyramimonas sp., Strain CCMP2087" /LENGTH=196 /DNA_ID=CAMNT_0043886389 /DNA_START=358 /DNA_END=948 /DNA_ORIENTATION=+
MASLLGGPRGSFRGQAKPKPTKSLLSHKQNKEIRECFEMFVGAEPGFLHPSEFESAMRTYGLANGARELQQLFATADSNHDGKLDLEEWKTLISCMLTERNASAQRDLDAVMSLVDNDGRADPKERLKRIAEGMQHEISEEEIKDLVNGKGLLEMGFKNDELHKVLLEITQPMSLTTWQCKRERQEKKNEKRLHEL